MLGMKMAKVRTVWIALYPWLTPGSRNWWWNPTGRERGMKRRKAKRAKGSLKSRPPACRGRRKYQER